MSQKQLRSIWYTIPWDLYSTEKRGIVFKDTIVGFSQLQVLERGKFSKKFWVIISFRDRMCLSKTSSNTMIIQLPPHVQLELCPVYSKIYQCILLTHSCVITVLISIISLKCPDTQHLLLTFCCPGASSLRSGYLASWLWPLRSHGAGVYNFLFPSQPHASEKLRPCPCWLTWFVWWWP